MRRMTLEQHDDVMLKFSEKVARHGEKSREYRRHYEESCFTSSNEMEVLSDFVHAKLSSGAYAGFDLDLHECSKIIHALSAQDPTKYLAQRLKDIQLAENVGVDLSKDAMAKLVIASLDCESAVLLPKPSKELCQQVVFATDCMGFAVHQMAFSNKLPGLDCPLMASPDHRK
eukprot:TRINITY_DN66301_c0_g1_i1.p1 TRINITY_DN66301_c0_g1~~TRINITY_DN66301_c0_g1_i1.p1  ORF type:complete len:172 (+),score=37.06 TRINITY_DN66301_c0_g1_i1:242-757(+)